MRATFCELSTPDFGVVYHEVTRSGQKITCEIYCAQLQHVHELLEISSFNLATPTALAEVHEKVLLLNDNVRTLVAKKIQHKLMELVWDVLPHPPNSRDIFPADFLLI